MKHISFFETEPEFHGGTISLAKRRKKARPIGTKRPLHLVLKAKYRILFKHKELLYKEIYAKAAHFGLTAYGVAVNHDHVHFILRIASRSLYHGFIRALTGVIARKFGKGIWKLVPFTRVMHWGKDFRRGLAYLRKNREEASGARPYEPRTDWYAKWRPYVEAA